MAERDLLVGKSFIDDAWRRIRRNLRQAENEKESRHKRVAELAYDADGYRMNVII